MTNNNDWILVRKSKHVNLSLCTPPPSPSMPKDKILSLLESQHNFSITQIYASSLICYGIGSLSTYQARYQFLYASKLKIPKKFIYDPVMTEVDKEIATEYGFIVVDHEYANRKITEETLIFMPRCPILLFDNLFKTNIHNLHLLTIVGNDLDDMRMRYTEKAYLQMVPNIAMCRMEIEELLLESDSGCSRLQESFEGVAVIRNIRRVR